MSMPTTAPSCRLSKRQDKDEGETSSELSDKEKTETSRTSKNEPTKTTETSSNSSAPTISESASGSTSTSTNSTSEAAVPWASAHPGSMQPFSDADNTVKVVGVSSGFTFACPKKGDSWQDVKLGTELQAKYAEGVGCYMEYVFTGDSIQIFGTTGTEAGIFGCFVTTPLWNATEWWDASGGATMTNAYAGSCQMKGLGYSEHTVRLVNSPVDPKKVYFTGLRFSTNKTQVPWSTHEWDTCCPPVTWPDGKAPTIEIGGAASTNGTDAGESNSVIAGMSNGTALFVIMSAVILVAIASILLFAMICKARPAAERTPQQKLKEVMSSGERRPRKLSKRSRSPPSGLRQRRRDPSPSDSTVGTTTAEDTEGATTDDEKDERGQRKRHSTVEENHYGNWGREDS